MSDLEAWLNRYSHFYQNLTRDELRHCDQLFSDQVRFKDPFNDVRGISAVKRVFQHMFELCDINRFVIHDSCGHDDTGYIAWTFHYRIKGKPLQRRIEGVSQVKFNIEGKVVEHIDYWDSAEYVYEGLPLIGWLLKKLRMHYLRAI